MLKEVMINLLSSPVTWGVIGIVLCVIIGLIVKKTKTKKDDMVWHKIQGMIHGAFNTAEKFIPDTAGGGLGKIDKALKVFIEEYKKREGKMPDEDLIEFAKDEWSILATELKKK